MIDAATARALEVADAAAKARPVVPNPVVDARFFALEVLAAKVREMEGVEIVAPKTCHCRTTWPDFESNRISLFRLLEIEKKTDALLERIGGKDRPADVPEPVIEAVREIQKKARLARTGASE